MTRTGLIGLALAALIAMLPVAAGAAKDAASLTVLVQNMRSGAGQLHVAIWDRSDGFGDGELTRATRVVPAADGEQRVVFEDLPPGRYALAAYHDENGNGNFDRSLIGLPAEGLGFSNGAWIEVFGPPSFDAAAIELDRGVNDTVIVLRY